ncbi:PQQ-dependent sugar dehydrogenase, partial [Pseudomonadota bacterium]
MRTLLNLFSILLISLISSYPQNALPENKLFRSAQHDFKVTVVVEDLDHPWGMAFLPNGNLLITERSGNLRLVKDGKLAPKTVAGLPNIRQVGQGGLLGIALHPNFSQNRWVYLSYSGEHQGRYGTEVLRGRFDGMRIRSVETIFKAIPKVRGGRHFGSRLLFASDGTLFISLGDRGSSPANGRSHPSQQLGNHLGSLI